MALEEFHGFFSLALQYDFLRFFSVFALEEFDFLFDAFLQDFFLWFSRNALVYRFTVYQFECLLIV